MEEQKEASVSDTEFLNIVEAIFNRFESLFNQFYQIPNWLTNVSLAMLGFHVALLLQLKFNNIDIVTTLAIAPLILLMVSILIGFYLKFQYGMKVVFQNLIEQQENMILLHKNIGEDKEKIKESRERITTLKKKKMHIPINFISAQFGAFIASTIGVSTYLIRVLFFS